MSLREGMETDAVRDVAGAMLELAARADGVRDSGSAMLRALAGVWEGDDVVRFQQGWEDAGPRLSEAAEGLRGAGEGLRRQVGDQVAASGGEGSGGGGDDGGWGWPHLDLPDLDFPDLDNPFDGMGWEVPAFFSWPDIDWGGLWEGFLDVLEDIGDWWDDLPIWAQIVIGVVAAAVIVVVAILAGVEILGALAIVAAIATVAGIVMTILDMLDAVAGFLRDPEAAIEKFLDDPLAALDDLIWLGIGFLPFGIGKLLGRFRKPIKELLEKAAPWLKRKGDEIGGWVRRKVDELRSTVDDLIEKLRGGRAPKVDPIPDGKVRDEVHKLPPGKSKNVYTVKNDQEARDLFDRLAAGGREVDPKGYPGRVVERPDGTVVRIRDSSKSGGTTIDIKYPDGRTEKVHVE